MRVLSRDDHPPLEVIRVRQSDRVQTQEEAETSGQTVFSRWSSTARSSLAPSRSPPGAAETIKDIAGRYHHGVPEAAGAAAAAAGPAAARGRRDRESSAEGLPDRDGADGDPEGHSAGQSEREPFDPRTSPARASRAASRPASSAAPVRSPARPSWRPRWTIRCSRSPSRRRGIRRCCRGRRRRAEVDCQYVVDTTGHAEPSSFKVLKTTHPPFVAPAQGSDHQGRVQAGASQGRPVRQLVQQRISFNVGQ